MQQTSTTPARLNIKKEPAESNRSSTLEKSSLLDSFIVEYGEEEPQVSYYAFLTHSRARGMKMKRLQRIERKRAVKEVLSKMVLRKYLVSKKAVQKILSLHQNQKECSGSIEHQISSKLIRKTKINVEISILRSLGLKIETPLPHQNQKIAIKNVGSLTIHPHQEFSLVHQERAAIVFLSQCLKEKLRSVISEFRRGPEKGYLLREYFRKVTKNFNQNRLSFVNKLKIIHKLKSANIIETKRKVLRNCINRCLSRRDRIIAQGLRTLSVQKHKKVIDTLHRVVQLLSVKIASDFMQVIKYSYSKNVTSTDEASSSPELVSFGVQSEPIAQLQPQTANQGPEAMQEQILSRQQYLLRLINKSDARRYLAQWRIKIRQRAMAAIVARKIAANPKITIFRSFSRLRINAVLN